MTHEQIVNLLRERGIEITAEGGADFEADVPWLTVSVKVDGAVVFEKEGPGWVFGAPEYLEDQTPPVDGAPGPQDNSDWFPFFPNEPRLANGFDVQARWQDWKRVFRHRRKGETEWCDGAPWEE